MKKILTLILVVFCLNSLTAQVPCQNFFASPACDNFAANIGPNVAFWLLNAAGTCPTAIAFPPGSGPKTGDLIFTTLTECNTYNFSTCGLVGFDSYIRVWNAATGELIAANDDLAFGCGGFNPFASAVTFTANFSGLAFISVNDYGAPNFTGCDNSGVQFGLTLVCTPGNCPDNDDVCNATTIETKKCKTVTVPFDNTFATPDGPSPGPGTSPSCNATDGWCNLAGIVGPFLFAAGDPCVQNDVWFCFKAPGKGTITIESVLDNLGAPDFGDTQLAVWAAPPGCGNGNNNNNNSGSSSGSGSDSGSSTSSSDDHKEEGCCCPDDVLTLVEIAANDDDGPVLGSRLELTVGKLPKPSSGSSSGSGSGSGSSTSSSNDAPIPDLISGQHYYIQIDGFNDPFFAPFAFPYLADGLARGTGTLSITHTPPKGCSTSSSSGSSDDKRGDGMAEEFVEENDRTIVEAFPNPFSSRTTISFTLGERSDVTLEVFNTTGARVALLHNGPVEAGVKTNVEFDASNLPVGIYTYRLTTGNKVYHDKLSVVK